ncbi:uncharacterized protein LOC125765048 [Anopheles funestus]|uniref:uncharacterized protein LOC125765048 n=1 Tax=Anopheles funestus TaxID=62324 RepID=UPI0020C6F269|nr:uncharacterized protein LOC125765048 [Anopheles funestus]
MELASKMINEKRDFHYNGKDSNNFVRCCACRCYTPFIFYIVSAPAIKTMNIYLKHNFFCAECVPKPLSPAESDALYPTGSILNNPEIMDMFEGYKFYNPYYHKFATKNILIITESAKIRPSYKAVIRKPLPTEAKVEKICKLFPLVHQLPNKKYDTTVAMYEALRRKFKEIREAYDATNLSPDFHDNIDLLVDRTPQTSRSRSQIYVTNSNSSYASDVYQMRTAASEEDSLTPSDRTMVQISSEMISDHFQLPDSEEPVAPNLATVSTQEAEHSPNMINISSQEPENENESGPASSISNLSQNSSIATIISTGLNNSRTQPRQGFSDSQEAGPSGLQQRRDETPLPKRRRITAVNPSPADVQSGRTTNSRMPRLHGG